MKKKTNDLRADYDFGKMSGGVRGKYAKSYRAGTNIAVLADDVASAFPTDDSVNRALRAIMAAAEEIPRRRKPTRKAPRRNAAKSGQNIGRRKRTGIVR